MPEIPNNLEITFPCSCISNKMNSTGDRIDIHGLNLSTTEAASLAWLTNHPGETAMKLELKLDE